MTTIQLTAQLRVAGKARRLRREGLVPAVIYGRGGEPEHIALPTVQVTRLLTTGARGMLQLALEGAAGGLRTVMLRDMQQDPIRGDVIHIDFLRVSLVDKVQTTIPVTLMGEDALPASTILQQLLYEVEVEGLPQDLPEVVTIDISGMVEGDTLHVAALTLPESIIVLNEPEQAVVQLTERRALPDPDELDEAAAATEAEASADEAAQD